MIEIVDFKLAKLLKECGFRRMCSAAYLDLEPYMKFEEKVTEYIHRQNHNEKEHRYSAPTISEVVMWLYEYHNMWLYVKQGYAWECVVQPPNNSVMVLYHDSTFNSPCDAYIDGIEHVLDNILKTK